MNYYSGSGNVRFHHNHFIQNSHMGVRVFSSGDPINNITIDNNIFTANFTSYQQWPEFLHFENTKL